VKLWGLYETIIQQEGIEKEVLLFYRERKEDCQDILDAIERSNINFDRYIIKEIAEWEECPKCLGSRKEYFIDSPPKDCDYCNGEGKVKRPA